MQASKVLPPRRPALWLVDPTYHLGANDKLWQVEGKENMFAIQRAISGAGGNCGARVLLAQSIGDQDFQKLNATMVAEHANRLRCAVGDKVKALAAANFKADSPEHVKLTAILGEANEDAEVKLTKASERAAELSGDGKRVRPAPLGQTELALIIEPTGKRCPFFHVQNDQLVPVSQFAWCHQSRWPAVQLRCDA